MKRFYLILLCLVILPLCFIATPTPGQAQDEPVNVILIGWDGCQRNHLNECLQAGQLPNLASLIATGVKLDTEVFMTGLKIQKTVTKPGWTEVLTGCSPTVTGVYNNKKNYQPIPDGLTIFEKLDSSIITLAVIGKGNQLKIASGELLYNTVNDIDQCYIYTHHDELVQAKALELLNTYRNKQFFMFVLFSDPDWTGHRFGENSRQYNDAILLDDQRLGDIISTLPSNTLIYVTPDHGFNEGGRGHSNPKPDNINTWLVTNDNTMSGIKYLTDITPMILSKF